MRVGYEEMVFGRNSIETNLNRVFEVLTISVNGMCTREKTYIWWTNLRFSRNRLFSSKFRLHLKYEYDGNRKKTKRTQTQRVNWVFPASLAVIQSGVWMNIEHEHRIPFVNDRIDPFESVKNPLLSLSCWRCHNVMLPIPSTHMHRHTNIHTCIRIARALRISNFLLFKLSLMLLLLL